MRVLNQHMKQVVDQVRLGFMATVCPDGTPNVSPKGTLCVVDDAHLIFADLRSPGTVANLRANQNIATWAKENVSLPDSWPSLPSTRLMPFTEI